MPTVLQATHFPSSCDASATLQSLSHGSRCHLSASPGTFQHVSWSVRVLRTHQRLCFSLFLADSPSPRDLPSPKMSRISESGSVTSVKAEGAARDAPKSELKAPLICSCLLCTPNSLITQERRGEVVIIYNNFIRYNLHRPSESITRTSESCVVNAGTRP